MENVSDPNVVYMMDDRKRPNPAIAPNQNRPNSAPNSRPRPAKPTTRPSPISAPRPTVPNPADSLPPLTLPEGTYIDDDLNLGMGSDVTLLTQPLIQSHEGRPHKDREAKGVITESELLHLISTGS